MCVLAKIALFWETRPGTVCLRQNSFILPKAGQNRGFGQNSFVLTKAAQKCLFWSKWINSGKSCSQLSFLAKMALL